MKEKYVEERFPRWFEFGGHPDGTSVDIADTAGDVFEKVPREIAIELIRARNAYVDALVDIFTRHPEALYCAVRRNGES